jgi:hypothetical protein
MTYHNLTWTQKVAAHELFARTAGNSDEAARQSNLAAYARQQAAR